MSEPAERKTGITTVVEDLSKVVNSAYEQVSLLPESSAEYSAMDTEHRMEAAERIFASRAEIPSYSALQSPNAGVSAPIPCNQEGVSLEARVGFYSQEGINFSGTRWVRNSLEVWVKAIDAASGKASSAHRLPSIYMNSSTYPFGICEESESKDWDIVLESIGIVDAVVCHLLDGKIKEERQKLGQSALLKVSRWT